MKKIYFLAALAMAALLTGCSSDSNDPTALRIKRITNTIATNNPSVTNFIYEGDDVVRIETDSDYYIELSYADGKLTEVETFDAVDAPYQHLYYNYTGELLTSVTTYRLGSLEGKADFVYDGTQIVQSEGYSYDEGSYVHRSTELFNWNGGNLMQQQSQDYNTLASNRMEYTYAAMNNPFKNMHPCIRQMFNLQYFGFVTMSDNVALTQTYFTPSSSTTAGLSSTTVEVMYNEQDYPIEIKQHRTTDNELLSTVVIEYE